MLPASLKSILPGSTSPESVYAFAIGMLAVAIILSWKHVAKRMAWLPAALPGVVIATLVSLNFAMPRMQVSPIDSYVKDALMQSLALPFWLSLFQVILPALGLAIVASAESLLTACSIDVLANKRHLHIKSNVDRELFAQGFGNALAGLFGGIPTTGVMVRSAANLDAGGRTRLSTILHGVWIALFVLFAPQILAAIPLSALAAVLIITGIKLINFGHMVQAIKQNPYHAWVWPLTACAVVATDLLKGLMIGLVAAAAHHFIPRLRGRGESREKVSEVNDTN